MKVRRDAFVIHFVEREFTNPPGHAAGSGERKEVLQREAGKRWVRDGNIWDGNIWDGLRLDQPQVSAL